MKSIDTNIEYLLKHKEFLTVEQLEKLNQLIRNTGEEGAFDKFAPNELDTLFTLVKTLQAKVVTGDGDLLASSSARDLASLAGSISSLLRAFAAQQMKVDEAKEMGALKQAVLDCIMPLPEDARQRFFKSLDAKA